MPLGAHIAPLFMIGQRRLSAGDGRPRRVLRQLRVQRNVGRLLGGGFGCVDDGMHRALRHADGAVDAARRVNDHKVRALDKAIHRTHGDAVGVFALDTGFGNDKRHA